MTIEQSGLVQKFMPYPFSMLTIHFESPPEASIDGISYVQLPKAYFNFGYFAEKQGYMRFGSKVESLIILLKPLSMHTLFGFSLKEIRGKLFIPAQEILKEDYHIIEELFGLDRTESVIRAAILGLIKSDDVPRDNKIEIFRKSIEMIYNCGGDVAIIKVAEKCCVSLRTLERYFYSYLGITPGRYCQLVRMQNLLTEIKQHGRGNLKQHSSGSHYYDQSHLINSFKMFTGGSPASFLKERKSGLFEMEDSLYKGI